MARGPDAQNPRFPCPSPDFALGTLDAVGDPMPAWNTRDFVRFSGAPRLSGEING